MLVINTEVCTGCGLCLEVCPAAALYLVDGRVTLDSTLCRECEACTAVCPAGAISFQAKTAGSAYALEPKTDPGVVTVRSGIIAVPLRARVLPIVGTALAWGAREIVPRMVDYWLDGLHHRATSQRCASDGPAGQADPGPHGACRQGRRRRQGRSE